MEVGILNRLGHVLLTGLLQVSATLSAAPLESLTAHKMILMRGAAFHSFILCAVRDSNP